MAATANNIADGFEAPNRPPFFRTNGIPGGTFHGPQTMNRNSVAKEISLKRWLFPTAAVGAAGCLLTNGHYWSI